MADFNFKEEEVKEGIWFELNDFLGFIDRKGVVKYLSNDFSLDHFYIKNPQLNEYYFNEFKKIPSIFQAIKEIEKRFRSKPNGYQYHIYGSFETKGKVYPTKGMVLSIKKENEKLSFSTNKIYSSQFNNGSLSSDDKDKLHKTNIPNTFYLGLYKNPDIKEFEDKLIEKCNVKDIVYRTAYTNQKKMEFLSSCLNYYGFISKFFDVNLINPVKLILAKRKRYGGVYYHWNSEIVLQPYSLTSFFYLFGYHMFNNKCVNEIIEDELKGSTFNHFIDAISKGKTVEKIKAKYHDILDEDGNLIQKHLGTKSGENYLKAIGNDHLFSNFFSDYFVFHHKLPGYGYFHFTEKEIEGFSSLFEEVLKDLNSQLKATSS